MVWFIMSYCKYERNVFLLGLNFVSQKSSALHTTNEFKKKTSITWNSRLMNPFLFTWCRCWIYLRTRNRLYFSIIHFSIFGSDTIAVAHYPTSKWVCECNFCEIIKLNVDNSMIYIHSRNFVFVNISLLLQHSIDFVNLEFPMCFAYFFRSLFLSFKAMQTSVIAN